VSAHRRECRRGLERGPAVEQERLYSLAKVMDQVKAIDHLHRVRGALANAVRIEGTPIPTDHRDRGVLGQPGRKRRSRTIRQEVDDAMCRQINQDRAIPMAPPPGPLVDTDGLQRWRTRHRGRPYETEQGRGTGRQP
jgi:hypothetical protein